MGLRELRLEHVMTQDELATKAGVSNKTIVEIEAGRVRPHQQTIRKLAAAFGMSARDLAKVLNS
jgi:DNA-binding XRE family transcriptional regulator